MRFGTGKVPPITETCGNFAEIAACRRPQERVSAVRDTLGTRAGPWIAPYGEKGELESLAC